MGLYQCKKLKGGNQLLTWKIEEPVTTLLSLANLNPKEQVSFANIISDKKQLQWLAVRALLNTHYQSKTELFNLEDGRPYLHNHTNISISHSGDFVAILLNETRKTGVDIQKIIQNKIIEGKSYFINETEADSLSGLSDITALHLIWSIKEATYKLAYTPQLNMKEHITVSPFSLKTSGTVQVQVSHGQNTCETINLYYEVMNNYTVACTL